MVCLKFADDTQLYLSIFGWPNSSSDSLDEALQAVAKRLKQGRLKQYPLKSTASAECGSMCTEIVVLVDAHSSGAPSAVLVLNILLNPVQGFDIYL